MGRIIRIYPKNYKGNTRKKQTMDLTIIIPAIREPYLKNTVDSILKNATTDIEVIVLPLLCDFTSQDKRVKVIEQKREWGMRGSTNAGIAIAQGKYIMKVDAHCLFDKGFDEVLIDNCMDDWLMVPRRYSVREETWERKMERGHRDYHYFIFPIETSYGHALSCREWLTMDRHKRDPKYDIDELMTFQGSCWLANKDYFMKHIGYLDGRDETYQGFAQEPIEIGLKYWLGGGKTIICKKTWYAHLSKRRHHYAKRMFTRRYKKPKDVQATYDWVARHWMNNEEPNMIHKFEWLIDKFNPPEWPENWREVWKSYERNITL